MDESLAINTNCAEIKYRTIGIKERLMYDSDQYICSSKRDKNLVNKSGPVSCGLISYYLGYILMYGWSQSISEL